MAVGNREVVREEERQREREIEKGEASGRLWEVWEEFYDMKLRMGRGGR